LPDGLARDGPTICGRLPGRRPKRTVRAVPPGAVYFFVRKDGQPFDALDAEALWLAGLGDRLDEGFGRVVPGVWNPRAAAKEAHR
jgi:hypothetical protein